MRRISVGKYHIRLTLQTEAIGSVMERLTQIWPTPDGGEGPVEPLITKLAPRRAPTPVTSVEAARSGIFTGYTRKWFSLNDTMGLPAACGSD